MPCGRGPIRKYDVFDPEKVLPYVRDIQEWSQIEERIYRQFFDKHPDYRWRKPAWHNRRYGKEPQSDRLIRRAAPSASDCGF